MSKSAWIGLGGLALLAVSTACAEGLKVDPQETVSGNGGSSGDGGRRNDGGSSGDGGQTGDGGSSPTSSSNKSTGTGPDCPDGEVPCADGECIPTSARCNGTEDCSGGEDESSCGQASSGSGEGGASASSASSAANSASSSAASTAASSSSGGDPCAGQFECAEGGCVPLGYTCDLETDCEAGNDEDDCDWQCPSEWRNDGECDCGCGALDPDCGSSSWVACDNCLCGDPFCFAIDEDQNWACYP